MSKQNKIEKIRMPKGEAMAKKGLCDLTLAKLRLEANFNQEENHMFIDTTKVKREKKGWAEEMAIKDIRTFNSRLKKLEEFGLMREEGNYYILTNEFGKHNYFDVPKATLEMLLKTCQDDVIKVYLYLLAWQVSKQKNKETFLFSLNQLCEACGLSKAVKTREKMFNILLLLEKLDLIVIADEKVVATQNKFDNELFELLEVRQEIEVGGSNLAKAQAKAQKIEQPQYLSEAMANFKF